ncbi:MAG: tetratricopeptide repeat protein [Terriglobales bacterium]
MSSHPRRLVRPCFLLALALSASAIASASDSQWIEVQSPHFSVVTDAGEKRGRETAMRFEQMRAVFGMLMTKAKVNLPVPLQIVAFRNRKELAQFAPLWNGKPVTVAGLFQGGEDRSFIMLDMSTENPWSVVFHEYAHQLMNGVLTAQFDPWFEEGFAEYFSSIEVDSKEARVGKIPDQVYRELQQEGTMKVADLFRVQKNSPIYNESDSHRSVFYAESDMVVHYLYDNNLIPKLSTYFELKIDQNVPVEDALQRSLGVSAAQFDGALRNYMTSGRYKYFPLPTPSNIVSSEYAVKPLSAADSGAVLADIHLHSRDYQEKAIAEFQQILNTEPNHAGACRGLGYAYLQKRDFAQAGVYFKRAAQADSKDPRVHYYSALLMSREGNFVDRAELPEMIKHLDTAIALDPSFADPYMLLAFAQMQGGDAAQGLITMQKAVSLSPRNENYQFNLAQMYLNARAPDPAITILRGLTRSGNPEVAERANESLAQAQRFKAVMQERNSADSGIEPRDEEDVQVTDSVRIEKPSTAEPNVNGIARPTPPDFLEGTIVNVDCASPPQAILTIVSDGRSWKMQVRDTRRVSVIGAETFSCAWSKQKVALNYRATGEGAGNVISIEVQ